ncbi:hypothetical protein BH09BAC5_BH09BAC5_25290 [soil metagenome]
MKKKSVPAFISIFLFLPIFGFTQTGVFWFSDSASQLPNNKIISIKQNSNGDLFLLGKASDSAYSNVKPYWAVCDRSGKLKSQTTLSTTNNYYELNNFTICSDDRMRIWGTEVVNNKMTMSLNTINAKGEPQGTDAMMTNTNTLTGDVCQLNETYGVLAKTVQSSSTGKYHISIYKYNLQTDEQVWYKTLATDDNEEASKIFPMKDGSIIVLGKMYNESLTSYTTLIYEISSSGEMSWKKNFTGYEDFFAQGISEGKNKSLIYVCSYNNEEAAIGKTKIFRLDSNGNEKSQNEINEMRANGVLTLQDGNIFVYGAHFQKVGIYIISKASFKIYTPEMKVVKEDEMGMFDGPDAFLPSLAISTFPTASDFITAIQLSDGRIVCAGRVYMPVNTAADKIIFSERTNRAFLVIMDKGGKFRKE